ncbi:hypothetical protein [Dysgonomonas sp. 511]|uniref:hypothetical protein n=1 Tax=Dysgonomonas sp. 511 TaxID=2302930 RepID=UPI0013D3C056|nr:hypothetical protein [Dysgonomonas sp. 511]NDV78746.1 hypothetical protein [Dysgonomonas sp. 511]
MKYITIFTLVVFTVAAYSCSKSNDKSQENVSPLIDSIFLITSNAVGEYSLDQTLPFFITETHGGNLRESERWINLDDVQFKAKCYINYDGNEMQIKIVDYSDEYGPKQYDEINEILVRSPLYQTKEGAAVGMTLSELKKRYNDLTCKYYCRCPEPILSIKYPEYSLSVQTDIYPNVYFLFSTKQLKSEEKVLSNDGMNLTISEIRDDAKIIAILLSDGSATVNDIESESRY